MNRIVFILLLVIQYCDIEAQKESLNFRYGIGINNGNLGDIFKNRLSFLNLGLAYENKLLEEISFQIEGHLIDKGLNYEYNSPLRYSNYNIHLHYIGLNLLLKPNLTISKLDIYGLAGLSINYNIYARAKGIDEPGIIFSNKISVNKSDFCGIVGLGLAYKFERGAPFLETRYNHPFNSTAVNSDNEGTKYHQFTLSAGYLWYFKK